MVQEKQEILSKKIENVIVQLGNYLIHCDDNINLIENFRLFIYYLGALTIPSNYEEELKLKVKNCYTEFNAIQQKAINSQLPKPMINDLYRSFFYHLINVYMSIDDINEN